MFRKIIVVSFAVPILFLTSNLFAQNFGKIAEANFFAAKGEALYYSGRYEEAAAPLKNAIKIRPEHGRAHYYLALTYEKLGNKEKAMDLIASYLDYVKQTTEWLGNMDKEYIAKCEEWFSGTGNLPSPDYPSNN